MLHLIQVIISVFLAIAGVIGFFLGMNLLLDLATRQFKLFATIVGALTGAVTGLLVNSGGWFLGGFLWPLGGAVVGSLAGGLLWTHRIPSFESHRLSAERWRPFVFLAPALVFLTVTLVIPTIRTLYLSFKNRRSTEFIGWDNYRSIFNDDSIFTVDNASEILTSRLFLTGIVIAVAVVVFTLVRNIVTKRGIDMTGPLPVLSLTASTVLVLLAAIGALSAVIWNNVFWVVFVTGISTIIGLAIAVLADRSKGESLAKSLIFMPMAISFVGASVIWRFVYAYTPQDSAQIGLLNAIWVGVGGEPQAWIQQAPWNNLFLIAIMIWIQTGFAMVVLSASIKTVPTELIEAARVDGASEGQIFWRVTIPQIWTAIAVVTTTLIITVLKVYDIVKVMTNGEFGTEVIANRMFDESFINRDYGRGSALAIVLLLAVVPLMIVNVRRMRKEEAP